MDIKVKVLECNDAKEFESELNQLVLDGWVIYHTNMGTIEKKNGNILSYYHAILTKLENK